ncbi:uncharacterized protein N0V89_007026 [Didymosphaeria variabile]|uniref:AB hydrolase-1 domain-containing protein n=1 Tax=Didymosphaeria variabile TaxID=1932322 RepID=A0A9W9C9U9_9PLEO|nr:uncharacterized protein N0V89_007026 [Didymosphaeria variabile]KAJ4351683.1 hypothetical protein N0V89_007026 [Didymosphaeria variabile]
MFQEEQTRTLDIQGLSTHHTYAYKYTPATKGLPTFLLLHGFPSTSIIWNEVADRLRSVGYGVLRPDLLGYGDTSKPTNVHEYSLRTMGAEIVQVLESHELISVIGVGHDWGAVLLSRMWWYYPQNFTGLAFMSVAPGTPQKMDLDTMSSMAKERFGYDMGGYWYFLTSQEAPCLLNRYVESATSLFYASDPEIWKTYLLPKGRLREWLTCNSQHEAGYISQSDSNIEIHRLLNESFRRGGFEAPLNWYKSALYQIDADHEAAIPEDTFAITRPVTVIAGQRDAVGCPEIAFDAVDKGRQHGHLPDATVEIIRNAGHWMMLEKPNETTKILLELADRAEPGVSARCL